MSVKTDLTEGLERDFQSNERTFLAWLRTSLNVMALGVALAGFGTASAYTLGAGGVLVAAGLVGLGFAEARYRQVVRELRRGRFTTGTQGRNPEIAAAILLIAILVALGLLIAGPLL